jgi:hypothetical protein
MEYERSIHSVGIFRSLYGSCTDVRYEPYWYSLPEPRAPATGFGEHLGARSRLEPGSSRLYASALLRTGECGETAWRRVARPRRSGRRSRESALLAPC